MTTLPQFKDLRRADSLYEATKHLRFSEVAPIDLKDRLALATVAAGLRPVGVLESEGLELALVREQIINHGLYTTISGAVWSKKERAEDHANFPFLRLLHDHSSPVASKVLWFFGTREDRKRIEGASLTQHAAGMLLGYPECCVLNDVATVDRFTKAFIAALVDKVGSDEKAVVRAIKQDVGVDMPDEFYDLGNVPRTDAQFPFVLHVACDSCLNNTPSASALLNAEYGQLASELNLQLHAGILEVRGLCAQLHDASESERKDLLDAIDAAHRSVVRAKCNRPTVPARPPRSSQ